MADNLNELVEKYRESSDQELIPYIYSQAVKWVVGQVKKRYNPHDLPPNFAEDVALKFLTRLYEGRLGKSGTVTLQSVVNNEVRLYFDGPTSTELNWVSVTESRSEDTALLYEYVSIELSTLSTAVRSSVVYLAMFPEQLPYIRKLHADNPSFYIGLVRLYRIKRRLSLVGYITSKTIPKTYTGKALFVSSMYKIDPALGFLLLLTEDVSKFLQFCLVFEDKSVTVPKAKDLIDGLERSLSVSNRIESGGDIDVIDKEHISTLCEDVDDIRISEESPVPFIYMYFYKVINVFVQRYDEFLNQLIKGLNVCNLEEVKSLYEYLSKDLGIQLTVLRNIAESLGDLMNGGE